MDIAQEVLKAWGPPALIAIVLWIMLLKSEKREHLKDERIRMLENLLTESYGERIEAADEVAAAIHGNATALIALVNEIRTKK